MKLTSSTNQKLSRTDASLQRIRRLRLNTIFLTKVMQLLEKSSTPREGGPRELTM